MAAGPQPPPHPYYAYTAAYWENQRAGRIDNTKTGLLLLMIGLLIVWIPFIGAVGGIIALVGALLVILGREAFGQEHARNVILSIIFFFVGIGISIVGALVLFFAAISFTANNPGIIVQPSFVSLGLIIIVGGAITAIAQVLLTYALQKRNGRILLWSGYATSIALNIVNTLIIYPLFVGGRPFFFETGLFFLPAFLGAIPALLYAVAYYLARDRIVRREIPSPMMQQSSVTM